MKEQKNTSELQPQVLAIQEERAHQAKALLLADKHGAITKADINADAFDRAPNEEILKIH